MTKSLSTGLLLALLFCIAQAEAYEAGDWIVRAGAVNVDPDVSSGSLKVEGDAVPGTGVDVDDDTQLMLTVTYMVSPVFGVELLAATPFEHGVTVNGLDSLGVPSGADLGDITHLPPTLTALWYPMGQSSTFQPYIGLGLNYTLIWDESLSSGAKDLLGANDLKLDNSFGWAARAGFDYALTDRLSFNAGLWYIDIQSDASLNTALGKVKVKVDVDPWVYGIGIGYRF